MSLLSILPGGFARGAVAVFVGIAGSTSFCAAQGYDSIGPTTATTTGLGWLTSGTNLDNATTEIFTAAGTGSVTVPAGQRVNAMRAVVSGRGPSGVGALNIASVSQWNVHLWSNLGALTSAPASGNMVSASFSAPDSTQSWGTDQFNRPAWRVTFLLPGATSGVPQYFAVRANLSSTGTGLLGVMESTATGPTGLFCGVGFPAPGYIPFDSLPSSVRDGVLAYQLIVGRPGDVNADGLVSVQDIFDFLAGWFAGKPIGDYNGVGGISVQDIFDFLTAWFAN